MVKISIANQKGGVGKTTIAFHLIHIWKEEGKKVLAIDMDPQSNLSLSLWKKEIPKESLISSIFNKKEPQILCQENIYLVPSDISLSIYEKDLSLKNYFRLKNWLDTVKNFDYVIIDCPPSLGIFTINALIASDAVIAPVDASIYAVKALVDLENSITELNEINPGPYILGIILSSFTLFYKASRAIEEHLKEKYKELLFSTVIPFSTKIKEALILGVPGWKIKGDTTRFEKIFKNLADEIVKRLGEEK